MIDKALKARLSADDGVVAIFDDRLRAQRSGYNPGFPFLTWFQVGAGVEETRKLDGPVEMFRTLQQIDIFAQNREDAINGANAVREALDGFINQTWGGLSIVASIFDQQFDSGFEDEAAVFRVIQQYRITYAA